jgi:hypothetical protein
MICSSASYCRFLVYRMAEFSKRDRMRKPKGDTYVPTLIVSLLKLKRFVTVKTSESVLFLEFSYCIIA